MSRGLGARERARFDALLERVLAGLPQGIRDLLDESPLVVDDAPSALLMREMGLTSDDDLCGLHSGNPRTERSIMDSGNLPDTIQLFRRGILAEAGGWEPWTDDDGQAWGGEAAVEREIRITLLHEVGHHFGLEEEDLRRLGYE